MLVLDYVIVLVHLDVAGAAVIQVNPHMVVIVMDVVQHVEVVVLVDVEMDVLICVVLLAV